MGFPKFFSDFFAPQFLRVSPAEHGRPDSLTASRFSIIPTLVRHCYPPFLSGGAQALHLPTFRATVPCSGGHQIPLESSPFDGLIISYAVWFVKGFFEEFLRGSSARPSGITSVVRSAHNHLASPCSATAGVPRRGWGSHPLLTVTIISHIRENEIANLGKFSTKLYIWAGRPADGKSGYCSSQKYHPKPKIASPASTPQIN